MRQLGASAASDLLVEAGAVCDEMARRARRNVELIIERLAEQGYRFHTNDDAQTAVVPHLPPGRVAAVVAEWLETHFAAVPLTLLSWLRIVGDVWLVGTHPQWPESASADPLVLEIEGSHYPDHSIVDYYAEEVSAHEEAAKIEGYDAGPFVLPLAPDRLHKDNTSGGPPYGVVLPDGCIDALFVGEVAMPFVAYLNWVFKNGGFPVATASSSQWKVRRSLAADLLPL